MKLIADLCPLWVGGGWGGGEGGEFCEEAFGGCAGGGGCGCFACAGHGGLLSWVF